MHSCSSVSLRERNVSSDSLSKMCSCSDFLVLKMWTAMTRIKLQGKVSK
jgi:hypothetical protein